MYKIQIQIIVSLVKKKSKILSKNHRCDRIFLPKRDILYNIDRKSIIGEKI